MKNTVKALVLAAFAAMFVGAVSAQGETEGDLRRLALKTALGDAEAALKTAPIPAGATIAVLPVANDGEGYVTGLIKTALAGAGRTCVVGKDDPAWDEILREVDWDARKADLLDPATVAKFGRLKAAQVLLWADVVNMETARNHAFVEIELHAVSIETKRHLWGASFSRRQYASEEAQERIGLTAIPVDVRNVMIKRFRDEMAASLRKSGRLAGVNSVAALPLVGDVDAYGANIVRDVLASSQVTPVNLGVSTRGEARLALREGTVKADALLYGAVRSLSAKVKSTAPRSKTYTAVVEIQMCIEKAGSRELLWSDTVSVTEDYKLETGIWDAVCKSFPFLREHPVLAYLIPIGLVVALIVLAMLLRAMVRVR